MIKLGKWNNILIILENIGMMSTLKVILFHPIEVYMNIQSWSTHYSSFRHYMEGFAFTKTCRTFNTHV